MKKIVLLSLMAVFITGCQCHRQNEGTPEVASEQSVGATLVPSKQGSIVHSELKEKYAIVTGAYRHREYAERKVKDLEQKGYQAYIVSFRDSLMAVVICPSDDFDVTMRTFEELRGTNVCPQDGWILTKE